MGGWIPPAMGALQPNFRVANVSRKSIVQERKIYRAITNLAEQEELQKDLYMLKKWSNGGDLEFNLTKCQQLTLSLSTTSSNRTYSLDGTTPLTRVNSEKDLGIIIDTKLSFHEHISKKKNS